MTENNKSIDIFGIQPVGDSIKIITQGSVDGARSFLSRICLPAAEEFGLMLQDIVKQWRMTNVVSMANRAEVKLGSETGHVHPRLVSKIINESSWIDDDQIQSMWAGLLVSACDNTGDDDSNLLFINILTVLTKPQARILNYICENSQKFISVSRLPYANKMIVNLEKLNIVSGTSDFHRLDRELDHLRELGLLSPEGGFEIGTKTDAVVTPSALALNLYIRCQGSKLAADEYFNLKIESQSQNGESEHSSDAEISKTQ
jgi:Abortive infection alpha